MTTRADQKAPPCTPRKRGPSLQRALDELERTDPTVAKAVSNLERVRADIIAKLPSPAEMAPDVQRLRERITVLEELLRQVTASPSENLLAVIRTALEDSHLGQENQSP